MAYIQTGKRVITRLLHLATTHLLQGTGRERYVFFSFPHIGIDEFGEVGAISRPGRAKKSCACGALAKCLNEVKADGLTRNFAIPGKARWHPLECPSLGLLFVSKESGH